MLEQKFGLMDVINYTDESGKTLKGIICAVTQIESGDFVYDIRLHDPETNEDIKYFDVPQNEILNN